jgi:hypothetical protein
MLLDCGRLPHWRFADDLRALWAGELDYIDWIELRREDRATIGLLPPQWNDFDHLTPETRLLHTTRRRTQPWKTGLAVDYTLREKSLSRLTSPVLGLFRRRYRVHPDRNQEAYFYGLLAEAVDAGAIGRDEVSENISLGYVRPDSLTLMERCRGRLWPAEPEAA